MNISSLNSPTKYLVLVPCSQVPAAGGGREGEELRKLKFGLEHQESKFMRRWTMTYRCLRDPCAEANFKTLISLAEVIL